MSSTIGNASFMQLKEAKKEIGSIDTSNEFDKNKGSNFSPKSVISISKSSSFLSSDESDFDSLSNQFSSNLNLSRKSSSFSSFEEFEELLSSPLDLDEEDSKLIEEKEQDFDIFDENFPSPNFNSKSNFTNFCKEEFKSNSSKDFEFESDEPIFWPFDYDSYKSPDLENFLSMSPRKNVFNNVVPIKKGLNPIRVRLRQKNIPKKVVSNPKSNLNSINGTQKAPNMPSRLGKSSNSSNELKNKKLVKAKGEVAKQTKSCGKAIKEGGLKNLLEKEISIENSIGLHEFDGHEGIEESGGENEISLCGSPWEITSMLQSVEAKLCARSKSKMSVKKLSETKF